MLNYLSNRKQYVNYLDIHSDTTQIIKRVPRSFILGPLLFTLYINGLPNITSKFKIVMYADDRTLFANIEDFPQNQHENYINEELNNINKWFKINRYSLNATRMRLMQFYEERKPLKCGVIINNLLMLIPLFSNFLELYLTT